MLGTFTASLRRMINTSTWSVEKTRENYVKAKEELNSMQEAFDTSTATTKANLIKTREEIDSLVNDMDMPS